MTKDELKEELRALTGESIEEDVVSRVDRIISSWPEPSDTVDFEQRITALTEERDGLRRDLDAERERFKKRFWSGEDDNAGEGADRGPNMQNIAPLSDDDILNMWR